MFEKWYVLENSSNIIFENKVKTIFPRLNLKILHFGKKVFKP
jgi:hypothetical protein